MTSDDQNTEVVDAAMRRLDPPAVSGWADTAQIQAVVRRRRRRRGWQVGVAAVVAAAVVVPLTVTGGSRRPSTPTAAPPPDVRTVRQLGSARQLVAQVAPAPSAPAADVSMVATAEQDFSVRLLRTLAIKPNQNLAVSPASLSLALSMLDLGAAGETQRQISALLGASGATAETIASGWGGLAAQWAQSAAADKMTLATANSVWLQKGDPLEPGFMDALARYLKSGIWQVDFDHDPARAVADLNQWVSEQTHGLIKDLLTADDVSGLLLVLVNALYLDAKWTTPFTNPSANGAFVRADGSGVTATFMQDDFTVPAAVTADYQAVQLPYGSGRFAALMVRPTRVSLDDYVKQLSGASLTTLVRSLRSSPVDLTMPKFKVSSELDLKEPLKSLGMTDAFESGVAQLTPMSPLADCVAFVKQKAFVNINEDGTQAAAATAIGVSVATSAQVGPPDQLKIRLDHPFLFLIRDTVTGAILFEVAVQDPTAA